MHEKIEEVASGYDIYQVRREDFKTNSPIPFRVSPEPFYLTAMQTKELMEIGECMSSFFISAAELYADDERVRKMLDHDKPEFFKSSTDKPGYLFIRPDIILTENGFLVCENETSPFGLGLSAMLDRSYSEFGFETLADSNALARHVRVNSPDTGSIAYSQKTKQYSGQLEYLAGEVFSGDGREWTATHIENIEGSDNTYRAFYLSEYVSDELVSSFLESTRQIMPSVTPHMEEKALLALLWDKRFESFFESRLGKGSFRKLRKVVPPTWVVGHEENFSEGLPGNAETTLDLASLPKSKRQFVVKSSGFSANSSWSESVVLLHKKSQKQALVILSDVQERPALDVVQEFGRGKNFNMQYETEEGLREMRGRVRLTPYFSAIPMTAGELLTIKATICENTDYIHATTSSINTSVARA